MDMHDVGLQPIDQRGQPPRRAQMGDGIHAAREVDFMDRKSIVLLACARAGDLDARIAETRR